MLNKKLCLKLGLEEVLYTYSFKQYKLSHYYLMANAQPLHLGTNLSNTRNNKPQGNVLVFDACGCARDPMLREFPIPSSPSVGW